MEWIELLGILLLIAGFVLAAVEMVVPGFGAFGIGAVICLLAGVFCTADSLVEGALVTLVVLVVLGVMLGVILWLFSKGRLKSPLILREEQHREQGYLSSADLNYLLGKCGVAVTDLRPSGTGIFEDIRFDVVSEGHYISKGAELEIIRVKGSRLVVRQILPEEQKTEDKKHKEKRGTV